MTNGKQTPVPAQSIPLTPTFKLVFFSALGLTVISLAIAVVISFIDAPNDNQKELFTTCSITWKFGVGSIIGLIGGKAT